MTIKSLELIHQLLEGHLKTAHDALENTESDLERLRNEKQSLQIEAAAENVMRVRRQFIDARTALNEFEAENWT